MPNTKCPITMDRTHKPTQLGKSRIAKRQTYEPEFCEFSAKEPDADD